DQDVPDAGEQRDQRLADCGPRLHHPVGDAVCEVVLEEGPGLAHHVPVILPADAIRYVGSRSGSARRAQAAARSAAPAPFPGDAARISRTARPAGLAVINVTMRPMNTGMVESSSATTRPAANKAANKPFAWRA